MINFSEYRASGGRTVSKILASLLITGTLVGCGSRQGSQSGNLSIGDEVPAFYLKSPDGKAVSSDPVNGKPYVVAVFATWCPPCKMELAALETEVWQPLKDQGIGVYGINYGDEDEDQIREFAQATGATFPLLVDKDGDFRKTAGVSAVPQSYVVGGDGKILEVHTGYTDEGVASIKRLLQEHSR